jgi:hypothetical protein
MNIAPAAAAVDHPFPGLRPFEPTESLLFFGREQHTAELLRALGTSHFIAVVGASGSGKSSLVRAGLLPALYRGYLVGASSHWRIAIMRPGSAPVSSLCRALGDAGALGPAGDERMAMLSASSLGLVDVVRHARLERRENLLIVADQFEELFRYRRQAQLDDGGAEAGLFVSLLLQAIERLDNVYVVLTMRSDFLGECSQFTGLAEILSQSQFLIPRLARDQRQDAIERPLRLAGAHVASRLVQQLLNDSSDENIAAASLNRGSSPDPLPMLQHALMRTFQHWKAAGGRGDLDLLHYHAVGGVQRALDLHAEAIYHGLDPRGQVMAEKVFRALTTTELGVPIRRPTRLALLYEIVGAETAPDREAVNEVLRPFLDRANSLLVSSRPGALDPGAVLDIPHESLIWKWDRLQEWVRKEAASAALYIDLANDVRAWNEGNAALWRDPNLSRVLHLQAAEGWNEKWVSQYHPGQPSFTQTQDFLRESSRVLRNERWLRRAAVAALLVLASIAGLLFTRQRRAEENARAVQAQLEQIKQERAEARAKVQKTESELAQAKADLKASSSKLSDDELAKRQRIIAELQQQLQLSVEQARRLQVEQQRTAQLAGGKADVAAVNRTLEGRVSQLQTRVATVEKERQDAIDRATRLQDELSAATREINLLKLSANTKAPPVTAPPVVVQATVHPVLTLRGHKDRVVAVAYSPDGRFIATGSADHTAKLWSAEGGKERSTFSGHTAAVSRVSFSPNGRYLATSSLDSVAKIWDTNDGDHQDIREHEGIVYSTAFNSSGRLLATGGADGAAVLWQLDVGQKGRTFRAHKGAVLAVAFSQDDKRLATASFDRTAKIWDISSGKVLLTLNHNSAVYSVAFSPDGTTVATSTTTPLAVQLWDSAGNRLKTFTDAAHMAFSRDGGRLATGGNASAKVWDVDTGRELIAFPIRSSGPGSIDVAFSRDGLRLATGGGPDNTAVVWDVSSTAPRVSVRPLPATKR